MIENGEYAHVHGGLNVTLTLSVDCNEEGVREYGGDDCSYLTCWWNESYEDHSVMTSFTHTETVMHYSGTVYRFSIDILVLRFCCSTISLIQI